MFSKSIGSVATDTAYSYFIIKMNMLLKMIFGKHNRNYLCSMFLKKYQLHNYNEDCLLRQQNSLLKIKVE